MKQRSVLWWLIFSGTAFKGIIVSNFNIAIVGMVHEQTNSSSSAIKQEFVKDSSAANGTVGAIFQVPRIHNLTDTWLSHQFEWTPEQQGLILGSLAWLSWIVVVPGATLTNKYGAKIMYGLPHLVCSLLSLIQPTVTYYNFYGLLLIRIIQGISLGLAAAPCSAITAKWVPPNDRGRFITSTMGGTLTIGFGYTFFGWLMSVSGWEAIFYFSGIVGILWFIFWHLFMFNSPVENPRISEEEKIYIEKGLGCTVDNKQRLPTPWFDLLTSPQVWLIFIANIGYVIMLNITLIYSPTYFKNVHHLDLRSSAALAGLPHVLRLILSLASAQICDRVLKRNLMSRTNVRKLATGVLTIVPGLTYIGLAFSGRNVTLASILIFIATASSAFANSGVLAAMVDITPNYVTVIYGIGVTFGTLSIALMPSLVGLALKGTDTVRGWQNVFLTMAGVGIFTGLPYIFLANANVVSWNSGATDDGSEKLKDIKTPKATEDVNS